MSKATIKNFAMWAREELLWQVSQQLLQEEKQAGQKGTGKEKLQQNHFKLGEKQREELVENVAYTWFNRLIALRYMEVNHYLPKDTSCKLEELCQMEDKAQAKEQLIALCNRLSIGLPELFPVINEQTERLLPKTIFLAEGLIGRLILDIPKEEWKNAVEIIGWLHQYYNTEQKNRAFGDLQKDNVKISKERIPAVTQLFTPDWIVRYMVENSLGKLWVESGGTQGDWKYYCTTKDVEKSLEKAAMQENEENGGGLQKTLNPSEIKFIDPCMGSGHILVYAFELFMQMYREVGYTEAEAARNIVKYNLFGLDIDPRAFQLSYFTIMMKARQYDQNILDGEVKPNVFVVEDSRFFTEAFVDFVAGGDLEIKCDLMTLGEDLYEAAEYGSLVELRPIDLQRLEERAKEIEQTFYEDVFSSLYAQQVKEKLLPLLAQAKVMMQPYEVVVTNPPYMGKSAMDKKLREYVKKKYPLSNYDLYAVFMEKCDKMLALGGYQGMITQHSWMFLGSYEALRKRILQTRTITHMIHLGARAFEEISGEVVQTTSWIMKKTERPTSEGVYMRLVDCGNKKEQFFLEEKESGCHHITFVGKNDNFFKIPGAPVAYWVSEKELPLFETTTVSDFATVTNGMFTCDNKRFLRLWHEIPREDIAFDCTSKHECIGSGKKWFPYNKGGNFRRWYGNHEYVINFENFGEEIKQYRVQSGQSATFPGQDYYFQESLSWSLVSPTNFGIRYYPKGFVFDIAGSSIFPVQEQHLYSMLGVLASDSLYNFLKVLNPTINYQAGDVRSLPMLSSCLENEEIANLAKENVALAKEDWDSFETSWNYTQHPFVAIKEAWRQSTENKSTDDTETKNQGCMAVGIWECFEEYKNRSQARRERISENEQKINLLVRKLHDSFTKTSVWKEENVIEQVITEEQTRECMRQEPTVNEADFGREIRSLISYAVGCMFGRFAGDCEVVDNNLILLTKEDVLVRFKEFLKNSFGEEKLEENLAAVAEGLSGKKENAEETILHYFQKEFVKDHNRIYQKRPIYWMAESKKRGGFKALFYVHRYDETLLETVWEAAKEMHHGYGMEAENASLSRKERERAEKLQEEVAQYMEQVEQLNAHPPVLNPDDGILVNYEKLSSILS